MIQNPVATCLQPSTAPRAASSPFSSCFLEKLYNLVQSINLDRFQATPTASAKQRLPPPQPRACPPPVAKAPASIPLAIPCINENHVLAEGSSAACGSPGAHLESADLGPLASPQDWPFPDPPLVPRLSLEVCRSDLDDQLERLDREIEALIEYWVRWPGTEDEDVSLQTNKMDKGHQGHPLDLGDGCIHEDPDCNEAQAEQEALRGFQADLGALHASVVLGQSAGQEQDVAPSDHRGSSEEKQMPIPRENSSALAESCLAKSAMVKKPYVLLRRLNVPCRAEVAPKESASASVTCISSQEEEAAGLQRKRPRTKVGHPTSGKKSGCGVRTDQTKCEGQRKLSQEGLSKSKALRPPLSLPWQPLMGQPSSGTSPSSSVEAPSSKAYNFRPQSKTVIYASEEEGDEGEKSSSDGNSEDGWSPGRDGTDDDAEERTEEEAEEEAEVDVRPVRRRPQVGNPKGPPRSYRCPECGREFSNSSNMRKHLRIHKGEFPFGCHVCGKSYSDPSNLAKHQQAHTGERPHKCPSCPQEFFLKSQLDAHLRRHRGIRPFACLDCKSCFFSQAHLTQHLKIHVVGKGSHRPRPLLRCEDCNKTFAGTRLLRQHKRRHKHFECEHCGKVFTLTFQYLFHQRSHVDACKRCGAKYSGEHTCQCPAPDGRHFGSARPDATAAAPAGVGAEELLETAPLARGPGEPSEHPQAAVKPSCTNRPLATASLPLPAARTVCSGPAGAADPKQCSDSAQTLAGPLPQNMPGVQVRPSLPDDGRTRLSSPAQAAAQPKHLHTQASPKLGKLCPAERSSSLAVAGMACPERPPASGGGLPPAQVRVGPQSTARTRPLAVAETFGVPKMAQQVLGQRIVLSLDAQTCSLCQRKYLGKHRCKTPHHEPARGGKEEAGVRCQEREGKDAVAPQPRSPAVQPPPQAQGKQEPLAKSYNLREGRSQVSYANQEDEEGDSEDDWQGGESTESVESSNSEEDEARLVAKRQRNVRRAALRQARYMCQVCDKCFVHQRSLRQHMRLHLAFSCIQCGSSFLRSEQLQWHLLSHRKETVA